MGLESLTESAQPRATRPPKKRAAPTYTRPSRQKQTVVFDEDARREYLTGFSKRKTQRRQAAHAHVQHLIRDEIRQARLAAAEARKRQAAENVRAEQLAYGAADDRAPQDDDDDDDQEEMERDFESDEHRAHVTVQTLELDEDAPRPAPRAAPAPPPPRKRRRPQPSRRPPAPSRAFSSRTSRTQPCPITSFLQSPPAQSASGPLHTRPRPSACRSGSGSAPGTMLRPRSAARNNALSTLRKRPKRPSPGGYSCVAMRAEMVS